MMPRIRQRDILPTAVKSRSLEGFVFGTEAASASTSLANGERAVLTSQITQERTYELLGIPYITAYVGSVADANLLPGGSAVDEANWIVIPPYFPYYRWEDVAFARHIETAQMVVRNISAGSVTVIFNIKWRYLSPREGA